MKEATGELSTTVIAVVAIAAVLAIFTAFLLPSLRTAIRARTYCQEAISCGPCTDGKKNCEYYTDDSFNNTAFIDCECDTELTGNTNGAS